MVLQVKYQSNTVLATDLYNDLLRLHCLQEAKKEEYKNEPNRVVLFNLSGEKLKKYLLDKNMPSIDFFKASRFLDPRQLKNLSHDINIYSNNINELNDAKDEWLLYIEIIKEWNFDNVFNIEAFWLDNKIKIPKLFKIAEWALYFPTNSAECERSISIYNHILSDDRNRMLKETIAQLNFLRFNGNRLSTNMNNHENSDNSQNEDECVLLNELDL
ncbi:unnamed protein product [Brachionus calyciflorus]|uniref:HAT C-terminal dimerisation domain-containing protein n=1 Tax=Brachionus calyciflorus TaxID=104777 RepID=A0A814KSB0_9BILA|nr:unnamed protein product [Brachionus calyciflorus]